MLKLKFSCRVVIVLRCTGFVGWKTGIGGGSQHSALSPSWPHDHLIHRSSDPDQQIPRFLRASLASVVDVVSYSRTGVSDVAVMIQPDFTCCHTDTTLNGWPGVTLLSAAPDAPVPEACVLASLLEWALLVLRAAAC